MLTLDSVIQPASGIVARESDDELVVVAPAKGKYLVLNGTGATVFHQLNGTTPLRAIAEMLSQNYQIPLERAQADVLNLVSQLMERDIVGIAQA